jgi:hypothetical protein
MNQIADLMIRSGVMDKESMLVPTAIFGRLVVLTISILALAIVASECAVNEVNCSQGPTLVNEYISHLAVKETKMRKASWTKRIATFWVKKTKCWVTVKVRRTGCSP